MKDKYDKQIERLLKAKDFDNAVNDDWSTGVGIFQLAVRGAKRPTRGFPIGLNVCGCLTQIRGAGHVSQTDELTAAVRADARLPTNPGSIRPDHLPIFAFWQRRIDAEFGEA